MIATYLEQLEELAEHNGVDLLTAFRRAGLPTSTYYRARKGHGLRAETAMQVADALEHPRHDD